MINKNFIKYLQCPKTKNTLFLINKTDFSNYNIPSNILDFGEISNGLVDESKQYFYPIFNDIIILHKQYAMPINDNTKNSEELSFDKKRVFDYYNEVNYQVKDSFKIYGDSQKWVDFRNVSEEYLKKTFTKASQHYPSKGEFLLDIASGPVGLEEYMHLCDGYEYRVCVDISVNALLEAKSNLEKAKKNGIYICGDITNIPIKNNICDNVLCQHTLYHIPKNEQKTAVNELYRVAKPNSKIVIIYCWFYHSWFMNISLNIYQIYRILRHYAGKIYVRVFNSKPRLYFYPHSPKWFLKNFEFSNNIEFYCWRSTNVYFLKIFIHKWLGGKQFLNKISKIEDKHSKFMSKFGEFASIVITKN